MMLTVVMPPACAFWKPASRTLIASSTRTSGWIGALPSAPSTPPMWLWVSTRPGMRTLPDTSRRTAPAGTATSPRPDGDDLAALDHDDAVGDLGTRDRDHARADEPIGLSCAEQRRGEQAEGDPGHETGAGSQHRAADLQEIGGVAVECSPSRHGAHASAVPAHGTPRGAARRSSPGSPRRPFAYHPPHTGSPWSATRPSEVRADAFPRRD